MKKVMSVFLAFVLCLTITLPVFAAEVSDVDARIAQMEQTYNIRIIYDRSRDGTPAIGTGALATLDMVLTAITPEVVREVSAFVEQRTGNRLTYNFTYVYNLDAQLEYGFTALGAFIERTGQIEIFLPYNASGTFSSGESPLTMAHEFGHALKMLVRARYGAAALEAEWTALNGPHRYTPYRATGVFDTRTFFSEYSSDSFDEDFAETFAHAVIRNRAGLGFSHLMTHNGSRTNLGRKVDHLTHVLSRSLTNSSRLVANINHNATNVPVSITFHGINLQGTRLQYIGRTHPRFVLNGMLGGIDERAVTSQWVFEIGGWYVETFSGRNYLLFPGGYAHLLARPLNLTAQNAA